MNAVEMWCLWWLNILFKCQAVVVVVGRRWIQYYETNMPLVNMLLYFNEGRKSSAACIDINSASGLRGNHQNCKRRVLFIFNLLVTKKSLSTVASVNLFVRFVWLSTSVLRSLRRRRRLWAPASATSTPTLYNLIIFLIDDGEVTVHRRPKVVTRTKSPQ